MSKVSMNVVRTQFSDERLPFEPLPAWTVLLESSDTESEEHARKRFESLLFLAVESGHVEDAIVTQSLAHSQAFWRIRERIPEGQAREGANLKHDIALPLADIPDFARDAGRAIEEVLPGARIVVFGHLGDGNLHYNVAAPAGVSPSEVLTYQDEIATIVYDRVQSRAGSISAEHGIGQLKRAELPLRKSPVELAMMRAIKQALDPQNLMNPGKVL
jgi:FAD/FMN-containing dehydrogenase